MIWVYEQSTGKLSYDGEVVGIGYSGKGAGLNNPAAQDEPFVGPIPVGWWKIEKPPFDDPDHGPFCLRLTPYDPGVVYGRDGLLMHGDRVDAVGQHLASEGCIIQARDVREKVAASVDIVLQVIS